MTIDVVFGTLAIHVIAESPDVDPPSLRGSFRHTRLRLHGDGRTHITTSTNTKRPDMSPHSTPMSSRC